MNSGRSCQTAESVLVDGAGVLDPAAHQTQRQGLSSPTCPSHPELVIGVECGWAPVFRSSLAGDAAPARRLDSAGREEQVAHLAVWISILKCSIIEVFVYVFKHK